MTLRIITALAGILLPLVVQAQRIVCDETCKLADVPPASKPAAKPLAAKPAPKAAPEYAVVSPVGHGSILMTEPVAAVLAGKYKNPESLEIDLIENSRRPVKERAFANYYANPGGSKDGGQHSLRQYQGHIRKDEGGEKTPTPEWYDSPEREQLTIQTMPGGGYATINIELPKQWNHLMDELGYRPLDEFQYHAQE